MSPHFLVDNVKHFHLISNSYTTVYNEEGSGIFVQVRNFLKIGAKIFEKYFFENIASFSYRRWQTLSSDRRIIILLFIMKEK